MIYHGDLFDVLPTLDAESIDACATDPPYNLSFMGKLWDSFAGMEDAGFCYWLSGLIDGEGHFAIKAHTRGTHAPALSIKMRADEQGTLETIKRTLGIGTLSREDREPNPTVRWTVGDKAGCQRIVDLLDKYPLRAKKRMDYQVWRDVVCEWSGRPRGNRWHGAVDDSRMASLRSRLMKGRGYTDVAWSGNEFQDWCRLWGTEVLRVLKPGAHILAMGGTRTYHRMVCGLEDAGFVVRDALMYLYGSGFPKSLNLGDGRGTALKPGYEPIVLAWKPFKGSIKANVAAHSTGALNIDATRIQTDDDTSRGPRGIGGNVYAQDAWTKNPQNHIGSESHPLGRWPCNVLLNEEAAAMLDEQAGELRSCGTYWRRGAPTNHVYGAESREAGAVMNGYGDSGGASRFFYVAKPSREERDYGCDGMRARSGGEATNRQDGSAGVNNPRAGAGRTGGARNFHPTVKPVELMRWLVKLITPIGGKVLDPFMGSGTTGMACRYEQREFIGIEREAEYVAIAEHRIGAVAPLFAAGAGA